MPILIFFMKWNFSKNEGNCPLMTCMGLSCSDNSLNLIWDKAGITCGTSVASFVNNLATGIQKW